MWGGCNSRTENPFCVPTGDDLLDGGESVDRLFGSDGENVMIGGTEGGDRVDYRLMPSGLLVDLEFGFAASTTPGFLRDSISGVESIIGTAFDDRLLGDEGKNFIAGLRGNDFLDGRGGSDTLQGRDGIDTCTNGELVQTCEVVD